MELTDPQHPARKIIDAHKAEIRAHLVAVCGELKVADPNALGDALFLLVEGAQASTQTLGHAGPARAIASAANALIDAHARKELSPA